MVMIDFLGFNKTGVNNDPDRWDIAATLPCGTVVLKDWKTKASKRVRPGSNQSKRGCCLRDQVNRRIESMKQSGQISTRKLPVSRDQIKAKAARIRDLTEQECELIMFLEKQPDGKYKNYWFDAQTDKTEYYPLVSARDGLHSMITSRQRSTPDVWIDNHWLYVYEFSI